MAVNARVRGRTLRLGGVYSHMQHVLTIILPVGPHDVAMNTA